MQRRTLLFGLAATAATFQQYAQAAEDNDIVIGLSNGYFGTEWRNQMVAAAQEQFDTYKQAGKAKQLVVEQAGADVNQQIQDLRNMIRQAVSVITVNANSASALNGVINEAKRANIPVVSFDQAVTNHYAINVTVDHYKWGQRYAQWLAGTLGGKGNVVVLDGIPGHPAAEARRKAAFDTFGKYPGIKVVWSGYGSWDHAKAQSVMSTVIAAQPQIDGAFVEDSMGLGVLRAFLNAGRAVPAMTGEAQEAFLLAWQKQPGMRAFAQPNPPDISRNAIGIAVRLAAGRTLKPVADNTIYYPIRSEITNDNLAATLDQMKDRPDSYFLAEWVASRSLMHSSPDQPGIGHQPPLLRLAGITKRFGGVTALDSVDLDMQAGQILGLLGANGSGKSTLSRIIAGELTPDGGEIAVQGSPVVRNSVQAAASRGIFIAHQHPSLPPDLPVWEAMFLGAEHTRAGFVDRTASRRQASTYLQQFGESVALDARCGELGAAARQIVEIARALSRQPRLLILDEPTAALAPIEVKRLFACIRSLADSATGVIFISHRLAEVEALCDTVLVLRNGRRVGAWSLAGALDEARILTLMTGDPAANLPSPVVRPTGEIVLAVRALHAPPAVRGAEFELRTGEVLGLSGLQGQGQEELLEVLAGLRRPTAGEIRYRGKLIRARLPRDMIGRGICLVPNDRHRQGLFMGQTVGDNLGYVQVALGRAPWRLPRVALQRFARQMIARLHIKTSGPDQPVSGLSGGNQQKIVVGKWLGCNPSVLLLSDPTKGVDIRARSEIYAALRTLAAQGCAVLVFASDTQELLQHCDRILVMCEGRVVDSLLGEAMCESRIMAASFGKIAA